MYAEKDWEDIRKMPEHTSLVRDFSRMRHKYVHYHHLYNSFCTGPVVCTPL